MMRSKSILAPLLLVAIAGGCATSEGMSPAVLRATLTGLQEVPGPGDPDGSGTAVIRVNPAGGEVCWTVAVRDIGPATDAHIHRAAAGAFGPPVVNLTTPGADGRSEGCAAIDQALARDMAGRSFDYYVNVHTAALPAGAIRGQLRGEVRRLRQRSY